MIKILLLLAVLNPPTITWEKFYATIAARGVTFSSEMKELEGKRVRIRGYAVVHPRPEGRLFLTRFEFNDPHGVKEHDLPFDAVLIVWRKGITLPPIPTRPTIEGILKLGNNRIDANQVVTVTLEDAAPAVPTQE